MTFPGFNRAKRGTISNGDWDRDGKPNRGDCNAFDWKKQDGGEPFNDWWKEDARDEDNRKRLRSFDPEEDKIIKERLERERLKRKLGGKK